MSTRKKQLRYWALTLATCAAILNTSAALAGTVFFSPDNQDATSGSVETALQLERVGTVPLPRGRIVIRGNTAEITVIPEWQFDRRVVLFGPVLDTTVASTDSRSMVNGIAFLDAGEWINYFDNPRAIETVTTSSGTTSGRITEVTSTEIEVTSPGGQKTPVPLASVIRIISPRAFRFSIPASKFQTTTAGEPMVADASTLSITPIGAPFQVTALRSEVRRQMDDGDISTKKLVWLGAALSFIQLGQMMPALAVPLGTRPLSREMIRRQVPYIFQAAQGGI